jgi:2,3-bisphosphoglycerate-independent phosphoglycerate mutase
MGNSEVGHLNLGAGRIVLQDILRIDAATAERTLAGNEVFHSLVRRALENGGRLHLLGLLGDGSVHASHRHMVGLLHAAASLGLRGDRVVIHAFTDGRDTAPNSAVGFMRTLQRDARDAGAGVIGTVMGRYWGMDRDKRWERTARAWAALVRGDGARAEDPVAAIEASHAAGITDEFIEPVMVVPHGGVPLTIGPRDFVFHTNFRPDRARQLVRALADPAFDAFPRDGSSLPAALATMTLYDATFPWPVAFPPAFARRTIGEIWADAGIRQLRIAETEKYAHVTYFFSGRDESPFPGEDRAMIPSPRVATYDLQPEMSAVPLTDRLLAELARGVYGAVVVNYANPDMVGHTGVLSATVRALETVDACLAHVLPAVFAAGGSAVVTADHGNCESMLDANGGPLTSHTLHPVPGIFAGPLFEGRPLRDGTARLGDVAPTVLRAQGLPVPEEMTGIPLFD